MKVNNNKQAVQDNSNEDTYLRKKRGYIVEEKIPSPKRPFAWT